MLYFDYVAKDLKGKKKRGTITAVTKEGAIKYLKSDGYTILEILPMKDFLNIKRWLIENNNKINKKDKQSFLEQLCYLLESDLPLSEALFILRDTSTSKSTIAIARKLCLGIEKGLDLASAMKESKLFDSEIIYQIDAGKSSGNVASTLKRVSNQMMREIEFQKKLSGALLYPSILSFLIIVVSLIMLYYIVPMFADAIIGIGAELPAMTKAVLKMSDYLKIYGKYILLFFIVLFILYKVLRKNDKFKLSSDKYKLYIPVYGIITKTSDLIRICQNLSVMICSGITNDVSLKICCNVVKNTYIKDALQSVLHLSVGGGLSLSKTLESANIFPPFMIQMILIGEKAGNVYSLLDKVSLKYEMDLDNILKKITSLIEPIMIAVLGGIVGLISVSMLVPMYNAFNNL